MAHDIALLPGDGVGPEIVLATRRVLEATGVRIEWDVHDVGMAAYERERTPLPGRVLDSVRARGVALKGPTATPIGGGFRSANITLREELDLYVAIRPCKGFGVALRRGPLTDVVIVRMNHEDLYAGIEYSCADGRAARLREFVLDTTGKELSGDTGISLKPISIAGAKRVVRAAFVYAERNGRSKVTAVHKATVMRHTDGLFLAAAQEVAHDEFPDIPFEDRLIDTACAQLVSRPQDYDVLVVPVMYGDILSDLAAALVGSIGMAPGANVGNDCAIFEAVHGTAPKYAGRNRANPLGLMLSGVMLLRHIGEQGAADRLERAIAEVSCEGRFVTFDIKPSPDDPTAVGTSEVADAVIAKMRDLAASEAVGRTCVEKAPAGV